MFEVLSKCSAGGNVSYQSIFKILFCLWWLANLLALPGASVFLPPALSSFCLGVVGFYSDNYKEILSCLSTIRRDIQDITGLVQQNLTLTEQLQSMKEQTNIMNLEISQLNEKLAVGEHQANPRVLTNVSDYFSYLIFAFNVLLFGYDFFGGTNGFTSIEKSNITTILENVIRTRANSAPSTFKAPSDSGTYE